jgi:drug/metabolite transporter (DMT)-like permease
VTSTAGGRQGFAVGMLLLSGLMWGTTWLPLKHFAASGLTGLTMTLCTYGLIGVIGLPFIFRERRQWMQQWRLLLGAAVFGGMANACFVTALMYGEVSRAMLLFYLTPLWGILGGRIFLGETVSAGRAAAGALAIAGAVLVLGGPQTLLTPPHLLDILAVGAGIFYTSQNLCARGADRIPVATKTFAAFVGCGAVSALLLPMAGHAFPDISALLALQLGLFAVLWLTGAMWTQTYGVTHLEAGRTAVLTIFELVAAVVTALWIGGERLPAIGWVGAALIVTAALIEARPTTPDITPKKEVPA